MTTKKTFLKLDPEFCAEETAFFHILPIPYEGAVSFLGGAARGPDAILDVSDQMEYIDERYKKPFWSRGVYTHEPIPPADSPEQEVARIEQVARRLDLFRPERLPIALGGDHSVSAPLIRVAAEKYPKLSVLQFDAHSDLRDSYEPGGKNSHASVMARALEVVDTLVQVGIRSFSEEDLDRFPQQVDNFITPDQVEDNFAAAQRDILERTSEYVYLTIDMDVFDPAVAPGVGTPEPGGMTWRQVTRLLETVVAAKRVVGVDVVETAPLGGGNILTEYAAARLVAKIMTAFERKLAAQ